MDVLAHTLWANAGAKKLNSQFEKNNREKISLKWASFFGVFPDLFAFGIPMLISLYALFQDNLTFENFSHHGLPGQFDLASTLYNYSHSFVTFILVGVGIYLFTKKIKWVLLGWPLHILLDIPTHPVDFYPTPFLWPVSNYVFPYGFSWGEPWFMFINYFSLLSILDLLYRKQKSANSI